MRLNKTIILFAVFFIIATVLSGTLLAKKGDDKNSIKMIVVAKYGEIEMKKKKDKEWQEADVRTVLAQGDMLRTGKDSWAEVGFGDDLRDIIKVKEAATLTFSRYGPVVLDLLEGGLRALVDALEEGSSFEIRTPTAVCGARGTGWDMISDGKEIIVDAYEKQVFLQPMVKGKAHLDEAIVDAGKRAVLKDPLGGVSFEEIPKELIDEWNSWKEILAKKLGPMKEYIKVTKEPSFLEAQESYEKALFYIARGDKLFRKGFGRAKESYQYAEDYMIEAMDIFKELERLHGVNFKKEVADIDKVYRKTHVKIGQVKRKLRRRK